MTLQWRSSALAGELEQVVAGARGVLFRESPSTRPSTWNGGRIVSSVDYKGPRVTEM